MAGSHPCAVPDCITPAKIGQLMCRGHWFMVSHKTRRAVNATWRNFKKSPPSYTASRAQAIHEVQENERSSEEGRVGNECVGTVRAAWSQSQYKIKTKIK